MISFIIPTLNEGHAILKTLQCLADYRGDKEIIVSDGHSTDDTVEISRHYANRVIIYDGKERQTIAGGRNAGAKAATGDLFVFIDADVFIPDINNFFAKVEKIFQTRKNLVAMTTYYRVWPGAATWPDRFFFKLIGLLFYFYNDILHVGGSGGELQIVRAEAFRKIGGYDEKLAASEDMELFWRLAKLGRTHLERSLYVYHPGRRAHQTGWPKLLTQWFLNSCSVLFFRKSFDQEWKEVR